MDYESARQAHRDYLESRVLGAHPIEVVEMLYQVAIDNVNLAITHLKAGDALARARAVTKAEQAVDELVLAVNPSVQASFTSTLVDLYHYVLQRIIRGHAQQSEQAFRDALNVLTILAEAWSELKAKELEKPEAPAANTALAHDEPAAELEPGPAANNPYAAYGAAVSSGSRDWSA